MAGALQQQTDGHLDRYIVIHDQYSCQSKKFSGPRWNQVNGRLRVLPNPRVAATASPGGTFRLGGQKADTTRRYPHVAGQTNTKVPVQGEPDSRARASASRRGRKER
jgi:hypothetical protein